MPVNGGNDRPIHVAERGQSSTIGVVLLISITVIGMIAIVSFGSSALDNSRQSAQFEGTGHALTQLDSRSAMVALGDTGNQRFSLGGSGTGYYYVDPDAGWMNITHINYTAGATETIYNGTLGALVYETDEVILAYQGGGVWRKDGNSSTMVSPPEFHYRSATLTLPIIRVAGSGSSSGAVTGRIVSEMSAHRIFPNTSDSYSANSRPFVNPIEEGNVTITIHSAYYQAWADYFRTRTSGNVVVYHNNDTVELTLLATGTTGDFDMPAEGNSIELKGIGEGHPITKFEITLVDDDGDGADFSNLEWSLYAEKGNQRFEIHVKDGSGSTCANGKAELTVYYSANNGGDYQTWNNVSDGGDGFTYDCEDDQNQDFNGDGDKNDKRLILNLTGNTTLFYEPVSGGDSDTFAFSTSGDNFEDSTTFSEHGDDGVVWEQGGGMVFDESGNDNTTVGNVTNHYLSLMGPNIELTVKDFSGDSINEDVSTGTIETEGGVSQFLTFLHITENEVRIEFE